MLANRDRMQRVGRKFIIFLGFIFLMVGYVMAYQKGLPLLEQARASTSWPVTTGEVLKSEVKSHRSSNSNSSTYSAHVVYHYQIEGKNFEAQTVWFGSDISTSDRSLAQNTVKKYPVKQSVNVYYDPLHPEAAVLEPGVFKTTWFYYLFGWFFLGVGILMAGIPLFSSFFRLFMKSGPIETANFAE
ncbi:DUF3592 domain-containing protein [Gimesia maris]|uniref:DUF3592 domain-containing protein n=1 Tax=Gimesia maris TaxID=122 RepID=A0ABX5YF14_9PLAN|nr:DUF3592 domain-containing protein [Gimesia maris]HAW30234.1 DUF3592 domain-containing protein [Planctomycetaceae bacterium]EDL57734.1 hypothetical protein PM8797T_08649 [Gimesia maris DSM 8797]QDU12355.1 hypothetical protein CA11_01320 [Gimesia maris]QEG14294.1 hypothetical protein GmarT_01270 [Gimesia maris]QGQ32258.1 DUF3592 domain-containing protein [Gimesia maris]|tara:strand:- start:903 stop:1460 length:558 start_codon:yes stop_codon:yes gene_type:complete